MKLYQLLRKVLIWDIRDVTDEEVNECLMKEDDKMIVMRDLNDQINFYKEIK